MKISEKDKLKVLASAVALLLLVGTVFYHFVEGFPWLDSLYFCTVTLATVGYGDYVPKTTLGKIFTIGYIFSGLGILALFAQTFIKRVATRKNSRRSKT